MSDRPDSKKGMDRRDFIKSAGATAGLVGLSPLGVSAGSRVESDPSKSRSIQGKPNVLIIMVDEQRYPTVYESSELKSFRLNYLTAQQQITNSGMEFQRHYAASVACVPSRTSFYTGHYPSLHGVSNTDGTAKSAFDPDMFWLNQNGVPTLGNYFRAAGYRTFYKGKWHISHADLLTPGTRDSLPSYDQNGKRDPELEAKYEAAQILESYGFTGWIGPEPHGADPLNSGGSANGALGRDEAYAGQFIDLMDQLDASSDQTPWLSVCSFVNPHDIVLFGLLGRLMSKGSNASFDFTIEDFVPRNLFDASFALSQNDRLRNKPDVQKSYQRLYKKILQPLATTSDYTRLYYQLHYKIDQQIARVYQRLKVSRFFTNTIVVFTSDHGDLLGSHGGLYQKWYTSYDEALRVPLSVSFPSVIQSGSKVGIPTSHVDVLPTLLGLAGLDMGALNKELAPDFVDAPIPVGRDLSRLIYGTVTQQSQMTPIYFMTDDDPSRGLNPYNAAGVKYSPVTQPSHIETVVTVIDGVLWKYSRYFDNEQFWSGSKNPAKPKVMDIVQRQIGRNEKTGRSIVQFSQNVKVEPAGEQYEMYNLLQDPMEMDNLSGSKAYASIEESLQSILSQQRTAKRLTPSQGATSKAYIPSIGP